MLQTKHAVFSRIINDVNERGHEPASLLGSQRLFDYVIDVNVWLVLCYSLFFYCENVIIITVPIFELHICVIRYDFAASRTIFNKLHMRYKVRM